MKVNLHKTIKILVPPRDTVLGSLDTQLNTIGRAAIIAMNIAPKNVILDNTE